MIPTSSGTRKHSGRAITLRAALILGGSLAANGCPASPSPPFTDKPMLEPDSLTKPIEDYSLGEFRRFAEDSRRDWKGDAVERECNGQGCTGSNPRRAVVRLQAPAYVGKVDLSDIPEHGQIYARINVARGQRDARYNLPNDGFNAEREHYIIIEPPTPVAEQSVARASVKVVTLTKRTFMRDRMEVTPYGEIIEECENKHEAHVKPDRAAFEGCADDSIGVLSVERSLNAAAWIECHHGCCFMHDIR